MARQNIRALEAMRYEAAPDTKRVEKLVSQAFWSLRVVETSLFDSIKTMEDQSSNQRRRTTSDSSELSVLKGRLGACHYLRGDLFLRAAALADSDDARTLDLDRASAAFQTMPADFLGAPIGLLGYIGQARVLRRRGQLDEAEQLLMLLIEPQHRASHRETPPDIRRLALLEQLEIGLRIDPIKTARQADMLLRSNELGNDASWRGRARWLYARALATNADKSKDESLAAQAAKLLRTEDLIDNTAAYERLSFLAQLAASFKPIELTIDEQCAWATQLANTGHDTQAVELFDRLVHEQADVANAPDTQDRLAFGLSLWRLGRHADAAEQFQQISAATGASPAETEQARQWRAACLLALDRDKADDNNNSAVRDDALGALMAIVNSDAPADTRVSALRRWVGLSCDRDGYQSCLDVLAARNDLVAVDPYLTYAQIAGRWQRLLLESQATGSPSSEKSQASSLLDQLDALLQSQSATPRSDIAAAGWILRSQMLTSELLDRPRDALTSLTSHWDLLSDSAQRSAALALRVRALLALGMIDQARGFYEDQPENAPWQTDTLLSLAQAIADAQATRDTPDADTQQQVIDLCNRALAQAVSNKSAYREAARRAGAALLTARAYGDAERILAAVSRSGDSSSGSDEESLAMALLHARALHKLNQDDKALNELRSLQKSFPQAAAVYLALGELQRDVKDHDDALASFRAARQNCPAGSEAWWRATLAVVELQTAAGDREAAAQLLRVAMALYPLRQPASLRRRIQDCADSLLPQKVNNATPE